MTDSREDYGVRRAPRVPATAFPRPRLLERLNSWPDITVVHGTIGAGKTILLASWVASLASPVLWCEPVAGHLPFADIDVFAAEGAGVLVIDHGERIAVVRGGELPVGAARAPGAQRAAGVHGPAGRGARREEVADPQDGVRADRGSVRG